MQQRFYFYQLSFGFGFREAGEFAADLKEGGALGEHDLIFAGFDRFDVGVAGLNPYLGALQQEFQLARDFAEAVAELATQRFHGRQFRGLRDLAVGLDAQARVRHLVRRNPPQPFAGFVVEEIELERHQRAMFGFLALEAGDAFLEQLAVEVEADGGDVAALFRAEDVARAANLQVAHGDFKPAAEGRILLDRADSFARALDEVHVAWQENVGVGLMFVAADAPAELVQIAQPKAVGAVDDDGVGVRDIEAALDDGCANQHVNLAFHETMHHFLKLMLVHLAVTDIAAAFRFEQQVAQPFGDHLDALDAVVEEVNLAAAVEFALDGLLDEAFVR